MKIPPPTVGRGHKRLDPAVLRQMLNEGQSITEVAEAYGVSKQRVFQVVGPVNRPNGTRFRCPAQRRKIIANLSRVNERLRKGEYLSAIARDLKVSEFALGRMTDTRRTFKRDEHGTYQSYYRGGCRCDLCRAANAERGREFRKSKRKGAQ